MNNIRIGTRLGVAFTFILAMLLITVLTGLARIHSLSTTAENLAGSRYQKAAAAASLRYYATDMTRLVRNIIILNGDPSRQASFKKDYDLLLKKIAAASEHMNLLLTTPQGRGASRSGIMPIMPDRRRILP